MTTTYKRYEKNALILCSKNVLELKFLKGTAFRYKRMICNRKCICRNLKCTISVLVAAY